MTVKLRALVALSLGLGPGRVRVRQGEVFSVTPDSAALLVERRHAELVIDSPERAAKRRGPKAGKSTEG